jgi:hypothetical protein
VKKKTMLQMSCVALAAFPILAVAAGPSLNFTSVSVTEKVEITQHKVSPYRAGDKMIVVVRDPIVCGQEVVKPHFTLHGDELVLQYDLTNAPSGEVGSCTELSVFQVNGVPAGQRLQVSFAGGPEPFVLAATKR